MRILSVYFIWVCFILSVFSCRPEGMVVRANKENFSADDQVKIGRALSKHTLENPEMYDLYRPEANPEMYEYLNIVLRQAVNTPNVENRNNFIWDIFVLKDAKNMSAYTLPGGVIFLTDGFLDFIENEAQLIAILSHEMHYADHGASMELLKDHFSGLILGDIVFNNPVQEMDQIIRALRDTPFLPSEVESADQYSSDIICNFNYQPDVLASVLEMEIDDPSFPLEWTITRPSYASRESSIRDRTIDCSEGTSLEVERYHKLLLNFLDL